MSTENYEREINAAETELTQMGENMIAEYKQVITAYLPEAVNDLVERAIKNNPGAVESLGVKKYERLRNKSLKLFHLSRRK